MTGEPGAKGAPHRLTDEELDPRLHDLGVLAWAGEHLRELRRSISEQRILAGAWGSAFLFADVDRG
jgi:hypothetical protein